MLEERRTSPLMRPGHIFTIEPMVNAGVPTVAVGDDGWTARTADGLRSAQYEHMVLVADGGCEVLTLPASFP